MVTVPAQRCSSGLPQPASRQAGDCSPGPASHDVLTRYLPSLGDLPAPELLGLDAERAAALKVALQHHHRTDEEHLALLNRVLRALRRI